MRIIGVDPGYTKMAIAAIEVSEGKFYVVDAVVVYPSWKAPTKSLEQIHSMIDAVEKLRFTHPDLFEGDIGAVESQEVYKGKRGVNPNVLVKMANVSGSVFSLLDCPVRELILPKTWTKGRCKEDNECVILDKLETKVPADWPWVTKTRKSDFNHAIDAVGLALYLYEQNKGN